MSTLNLLCSKCMDIFKTMEDDIYATSCGHVFHLKCIDDWTSRSDSCPQCQSYNPKTYKLYLCFNAEAKTHNDDKNANNDAGSKEKCVNYSEEDCELKLKLHDRISSLVCNRAELEKDVCELKQLANKQKEKIIGLEGLNSKLRYKIMALVDESHKSEALSAQIIEDLNKEVQMLRAEFDNIAVKHAMQVSTIEQYYRNNFAGMNSYPQNGNLMEIDSQLKIKTLEQKLNHTTKEFQKEMSKSIQLEMENVRLQSGSKTFEPHALTRGQQLSGHHLNRDDFNDNPHYVSSSECANKWQTTKNQGAKKKIPLGASNGQLLNRGAINDNQQYALPSEEFNKKRIISNENNTNKKTQMDLDNGRNKYPQYTNYNENNANQTSCSISSLDVKNKAIQRNNSNEMASISDAEARNDVKNTSNELATLESYISKTLDIADSTNSILILNFPALGLRYPLENTVIFVASSLQIELNKCDVDRVDVIPGNNDSVVSIFVRFKTKQMKMKLLSTPISSSRNQFLSSICIKEYIDEHMHHLYCYAMENLIGRGFANVCFSNNQIFAKKNNSDFKGIEILKYHQVDDFVSSYKNPRTAEAAATSNGSAKVDDFVSSYKDTRAAAASNERAKVDDFVSSYKDTRAAASNERAKVDDFVSSYKDTRAAASNERAKVDDFVSSYKDTRAAASNERAKVDDFVSSYKDTRAAAASNESAKVDDCVRSYKDTRAAANGSAASANRNHNKNKFYGRKQRNFK